MDEDIRANGAESKDPESIFHSTDLQKIRSGVKTNDVKTQPKINIFHDLEISKLELEKAKCEILSLNIANENEHQNLRLRKNFAIGISVGVFSWICFVGIVTFLNFLEVKVIITLLTTTTVEVLGMMYIIIKYLFPPGANGNTKPPSAASENK